MRLGILSDTHNQLERTRIAVRLLQSHGAEALVHCGDLALPPIVEACSVLPFWFTFGNHDSDNVPLLKAAALAFGATCLDWGGVFELDGKKIGVAHGHLRTDVTRVLAESPKYLLSGHSHTQIDVLAGSVHRVNPGALHRAKDYTVALLDLTSDELQFLQVPPF